MCIRIYFILCHHKNIDNPQPTGRYSKVNNVFCLSLLCLLDRSYGSIPSRARSDRNVLGGSHGLPPHSSMYRYTNSGRSSLRPFYSSFSVNFLKILKSSEKFDPYACGRCPVRCGGTLGRLCRPLAHAAATMARQHVPVPSSTSRSVGAAVS